MGLDPDRVGGSLVTGKVALDLDGAPDHDPSSPSSEPWAAVIGADSDTAYVVARADARVYRVASLRSNPVIDGSVEVGSEPTAIAIAPSGTTLFVANFGEGTISIVTTKKFADTGGWT